MKTSDAIDLIAPALARAQAGIAPVHKTGYNPHFDSRFVPIESVLEAALAACAAQGITILQGEVDADEAGFTLETTALHVSGQWIATGVRFPIARESRRDKATGEIFYTDPTPGGKAGALTYARRIGCCTFFAIAGEEDLDGGKPGEKPDAKPSEKPKAKPPVSGAMGSGIPSSCPKCGWKVWDNREKKASGEYKATSTDWSCSNVDCKNEKGFRTGDWIKDREKDDATPEKVKPKAKKAEAAPDDWRAMLEEAPLPEEFDRDAGGQP